MDMRLAAVWLGLAVALSSALTIAGHYLRPPRQVLVYVFKPLTTILILVVALLPGTFLSEPYARAIVLGLLFSLAGDILLVLRGDRFLFGLAAFLVGLLCYAVAFADGASAPGFLWALLILAIVGASVLGYLWSALSGMMKVAVSAYVFVMVLMAALAMGRATGSISGGKLEAAIGAVLFMASDAMLAVDRFKRPFHLEHALGLSSYFAGQFLIALSVGRAL